MNILLTALASSASEATDWTQVATVTVSGIVVVFLALIALILIIQGYGSALYSATKKKEEKEKQKSREKKEKAKSAPAAVSNAPIIKHLSAAPEGGDIIAVIAAAVAAYGASEGKVLSVKSVKRSTNAPRRSVWAQAGISENTRPF
jgi:sodium pump decarboxylase gamma subunit